MLRNPRVWILTLLALAVAASAASARPYNYKPNSLRLRFGELQLDGESVYWRTREQDFFGSAAAFDDDIGGVDYTRMLSERWGVIISASDYQGSQTTAFRDFVDQNGLDIEHTATLEIEELSAGIVLYLLRRDAIVAPYIGAGAGIYSYDLAEVGDFIDFDTLDVFEGSFHGDGNALGIFFLVGLEIPVTPAFSIFGEARWRDSNEDLEQDFATFGEIDLGGREISLGAAFRF